MLGVKVGWPSVQFKRGTGPKEWFLFVLSIALAIFFTWFGYRLIIFSDAISPTELFVLGVTAVIAGIVIAAHEYHWSIGFTIVAIGFYYFARSAGIIKIPILGYMLAAASFFAGLLLLYITYPDRKKPH